MTCPDGYNCYRIWTAAETFLFFGGLALLIIAIAVAFVLFVRLTK